MQDRIAQCREYIKQNGLDALIIGSAANRMYLSGFTGSNAMLLITLKEKYIITDFRYIEQVSKEAPDFICINQNKSSLIGTVFELAARNNLVKIGFEARHTSYSDYEVLKRNTAIDWVPTQNVIEAFREIKDKDEIDKLEKAESIGDIAFKEVVSYIKQHFKEGITENQVALEIERVMRINGATGTSFDTIVAAGAKSSLPHATPSDNILKVGDFVVMDFGCKYQGYCSDMTRTLVIGEASPKQVEIYNTVLRAQEAALAAIKPGMTGKAVDEVARNIIKEANYGDYFGHGLGHSVGIEIHENPRFSPGEQKVITEGMVITVEPGIYLPNFGGVRIEDMVVITETGIKNLTHSPKNLIIID